MFILSQSISEDHPNDLYPQYVRPGPPQHAEIENTFYLTSLHPVTVDANNTITPI